MTGRHDPLAVTFPEVHPARLAPIIGADRLGRLVDAAEEAVARLDGRAVLNVNSTATGGGVAEMLQAVLGYARGLGVDARWRVVAGDPAFFDVTKRVHNGLYGHPGDGGELGDAERRVYERTLADNLPALLAAAGPGDVVVLHDPQTAGLAPLLAGRVGALVWRCHVGVDAPGPWSERAWGFVRPYLGEVDALVFSRPSFVPSWVDPTRVEIVAPSIDPFTPKNEELAPGVVVSAVVHAGLVAADGDAGPWVGQPLARVELVTEGELPRVDTPLVTQVSRWDRMKDMRGVLEAFAAHVDASTGAHLVLAGPSVDGVADDPEGAAIFAETRAAWEALPDTARSRIHLATIDMSDPAANARVVNALQRHARVVVQKSLAEGFGLTVAEAMWKRRPVVAAAVGGIVDQVTDGREGFLVEPDDLAATGAAVDRLLGDPRLAEELGENARATVVERFLADRHLRQYAELLTRLVPTPGAVGA